MSYGLHLHPCPWAQGHQSLSWPHQRCTGLKLSHISALPAVGPRARLDLWAAVPAWPRHHKLPGDPRFWLDSADIPDLSWQSSYLPQLPDPRSSQLPLCPDTLISIQFKIFWKLIFSWPLNFAKNIFCVLITSLKHSGVTWLGFRQARKGFPNGKRSVLLYLWPRTYFLNTK